MTPAAAVAVGLAVGVVVFVVGRALWVCNDPLDRPPPPDPSLWDDLPGTDYWDPWP